MRELVLEKMEEIELDRKSFGLHSLNPRGASAAANAGIPDRWFKRHGRAGGCQRMPKIVTLKINLKIDSV